jgi:hypothetical protein
LEEPVAGPDGGEMGVGRGVSVVRKGGVSVKIKRQEPPNGGFGQGTVVCCRIHGEIPQTRKYLFGPRCQENSLGNSCSGCSWLGVLTLRLVSGEIENQDAAIIERDFGSFQIDD